MAYLHMDVPQTRFKAGDTLTGTVCLRGKEDADVQTIMVSLVGRCKSKFTRSTGQSTITYRGRAPLFYARQVLFTGPYTLRPGHSWDFSFKFPHQCMSTSQDPFKQQGPFNLDPSQSLPPSFTDNHHVYGWSTECFVSYQLEARLISSKTKIFGSGETESNRRLEFFITRDSENPEPNFTTATRSFSIASVALEPGREDAPLTIKEKLKSSWSSKKLPLAKFKLQMLVPSIAVVSKPLPLILKLDHDIEGSTTMARPMVRLRKCSVELRASTKAQCIRNAIFSDGDVQRTWESSLSIGSYDFSGRTEPLTENLDLGKLLGLGIQKHHKPNFTTFNMRRDYKLCIKVTFECAQKTFKVDFWNYQITLLPADYAPSGCEAEDAPELSTIFMEDPEEAAPAYEPSSLPPPPTYQGAKHT